MLQTRYLVVCETCPVRTGVYRAESEARDAGRRNGWVSARTSYGALLNLCPGCAAGPRPDWWPANEETECPTSTRSTGPTPSTP